MPDYPIISGFLFDLSQPHLNRAKDAAIKALSKMEDHDFSCLGETNMDRTPRRPGRVIADVSNYVKSVINVKVVCIKTLEALASMDSDHRKLLFFFFDNFPFATRYGLKKALSLNEQSYWGCDFFLCGLGNNYSKQETVKLEEFPNCHYKHFGEADDLVSFLIDRTQEEKYGVDSQLQDNSALPSIGS